VTLRKGRKKGWGKTQGTYAGREGESDSVKNGRRKTLLEGRGARDGPKEGEKEEKKSTPGKNSWVNF